MNTNTNMDKAEFLENKIVMASLFGSRAHGTSMPDSDVDVRGVYVPDRQSVLSPFPENASISLEGDVMFWEARHFITMSASCNPNVLEVLWAPDDSILHCHPAWNTLVSNREELLSKRIGDTYGGFARGELKRLTKLLLDENHDTYRARKAATHVIRLLRMAHEVLRGEGLIVARPDREELLAYKSGALPMADALAEGSRLEQGMTAAKENSALPESVSRELMSKISSEMLETFWATPSMKVHGFLRKAMGLPKSPAASADKDASPFLKGRAVVMDLEGAGHTGQGVRDILEMALLETMDGVPTGKAFYTKLKPDRKPTSQVQRLHGIAWEDVRNAPRIDEVHEGILGFLENSPIIAHAAQSDRVMLSADLRVAGLPPLTNTWLCTAHLYCGLVEGSTPGRRVSISLDAACDGLGVDRSMRVARRHGAMLDASLAAECLHRMMEMGNLPITAWSLAPQREKSVKTLNMHVCLSVQDGQNVVIMSDGHSTDIVSAPSFNPDTHVIAVERERVTVRRREDNVLDNPGGICMVYWRKGVAEGLIRDGSNTRIVRFDIPDLTSEADDMNEADEVIIPAIRP